jgi:hypothetical protein
VKEGAGHPKQECNAKAQWEGRERGETKRKRRIKGMQRNGKWSKSEGRTRTGKDRKCAIHIDLTCLMGNTSLSEHMFTASEIKM